MEEAPQDPMEVIVLDLMRKFRQWARRHNVSWERYSRLHDRLLRSPRMNRTEGLPVVGGKSIWVQTRWNGRWLTRAIITNKRALGNALRAITRTHNLRLTQGGLAWGGGCAWREHM